MAKHCTKFEVFSSSEDISWGVSFKIGHVTLTTPPSGTVVVRRLTLDIAYNHTKFDDFSRSEDISRGVKF